MGLRKSTRKIFFLLRFYLRFYTDRRIKNIEPNNLANLINLHPQPEGKINIPKIIWIYWDTKKPELVERCLECIKSLNREYIIHILDNNNINDFCKIDFSQFESLTPQLKSDLLRLYLLYNHGGIWVDASVILYSNLDWIIDLCNNNKTKAFGYYSNTNTTVKQYPVIESWLLASEKDNPFFKEWLIELTYAIKLGVKNYIEEIRKTYPNYNEYFQNICRLEYLVIYVACQKVLRKMDMSISLVNCDENAFIYHSFNKKSHIHFIESLVLNYRPSNMPYLIKLIGSDRNLLAPYIKSNKVKKNSLLDF
ncbi:glycosyltransferase family 32 protein [Acinetobacter nosocomialis]|uniref:glycosyltransferase family 32 protein n=1 Tax=Acinetobacter nosocomialis TaxID=106654 RepID=UPI001A9B6535|nr:capsular polysaccharide synthesis protein [Acinetobacter nosocomialis]MBO1278930.1 hypothetical protein [Acinetobacter nosocomialis]